MDALQRNQQRQKETNNSMRPPLASQSNVIDLTEGDAFGPMPLHSSSSLQHDQPQSQQNRLYPRPPSQNTWRNPGRDKHTGPSKVKMFDASFQHGPARPAPPTFQPSSTSDKVMPPQMNNDGFAYLGHRKAGNAPLQKITAQSVDLSQDAIDDDEPPPNDFSYTAMSISEREQQLQDMLSSMVNPPEVGDIDFETAKNVKGLNCELLPHQVAGLLWMKEREGGRFKGGILADDMGLGKTVQMLALIMANSPTTPDCTIDAIRPVPGEVSTKKKKKDDQVIVPEKVTLKSKTTLILAPLAVIRQWEREAKEKVNTNLRVLVHHGSARAKTSATFAKYDVVITTYTTASSEWSNYYCTDKKKKKKKQTKNAADSSEESDDSEDSQSSDDSEPIRGNNGKKQSAAASKKAPAPLFEAQWLRVVLDEAQNIKNHRTKASIACAALSRNSLSKWCLSGTPIQNDALEMFSLIRFLGIPPFNEYGHFREKIADPLKSNNQNRVNWGMKRLCVVLRTIMLRRTKDSTHDGKPLISLPTRTINIVSNDFDNESERQFYDDLELQAKKKLEDAEGEGVKVNQMATLLMLLRLRQACSHPYLLTRHIRNDAVAASAPGVAPRGDDLGSSSNNNNNNNRKDDDDDDGLADLLAGLSVVTRSCERCQAVLPKELSQEKNCKECKEAIDKEKSKGIDWTGKASTKIRVMLKILDDIRRRENGEKTIVFSQFTSFLDLVEPFLRRENYKYVRYDGSMRADDRERSLEKIRNDSDTRVIIISFMAGSTGLNLTACSRVILMDLWWNPQLEEQAFDRSHRLGQQRPVEIYKLTILRSVEERILELQAKKRALAKAALEGSKFSKGNKLDKKELMYLFSGGPMV